MAGNKGVIMFMLATLILGSFFGVSSAKSFVVGGSTGWTIPPSPSLYSNWAAQQKLQVGDVLVFTFPAGAHTVAEVSKANYDACTSAAPLGPVMSTAPANITLTKPGTHYFICTVTGHCGANQKLTVTAAALAATPTPSPIPAPKSSPIASPKSSPTPAPTPTPSPMTSPASSPTPSPTPTPTPAPSATSPAPTPVADTPAAGGPTVPASASSPAGSSDGGSASPPAGNFAASTSVSLLSLLSIVAIALVF